MGGESSVGREVAPWQEGQGFESTEQLPWGALEQGAISTHCSPGASLAAVHCFIEWMDQMQRATKISHVWGYKGFKINFLSFD